MLQTFDFVWCFSSYCFLCFREMLWRWTQPTWKAVFQRERVRWVRFYRTAFLVFTETLLLKYFSTKWHSWFRLTPETALVLYNHSIYTKTLLLLLLNTETIYAPAPLWRKFFTFMRHVSPKKLHFKLWRSRKHLLPLALLLACRDFLQVYLKIITHFSGNVPNRERDMKIKLFLLLVSTILLTFP